MTKTISITKAREEFPKIVNRASRLLEKYIITVNGKSKAIVMSTDEYESLEETLAILSEPGALEDIKQAEKEFEEGKSISLEQLKKDLKFDV
jgi:prevent-host-death family protein